MLCFLGKQQKRVALLVVAAVFEGASIGPLIDLAIEIDPRCVPHLSNVAYCVLVQLVWLRIFSIDYELDPLSSMLFHVWDHFDFSYI